MATEKTPAAPKVMPLPAEGGSYSRNDTTGALTRAPDPQPTDPTETTEKE